MLLLLCYCVTDIIIVFVFFVFVSMVVVIAVVVDVLLRWKLAVVYDLHLVILFLLISLDVLCKEYPAPKGYFFECQDQSNSQFSCRSTCGPSIDSIGTGPAFDLLNQNGGLLLGKQANQRAGLFDFSNFKNGRPIYNISIKSQMIFFLKFQLLIITDLQIINLYFLY